MKDCPRCDKTLRDSCFRKKGNSLRSYCKKCESELDKIYYKNNKNKQLAQKKKYYRKNKEAYRLRDVKYRYGLDSEDYKKMLTKQRNKCRICDKAMSRVCVDHDHRTGTIRGLLCHKCNIGIGCFKENVTFIKNAIKYLEKFNGKENRLK